MLTNADTNTPTKPDDKRSGVRTPDRNPRRERRLWHQPEQPTQSLGCTVCPEKPICGGLRLKAAFFDCFRFCCHQPDACDRVCRNHPDYPDRVREVETFDLQNVPRAQAIAAPSLPPVVPVIYHRTGRSRPPVASTVALPLYSLFDRRSGSPLYASHEALCTAFGVRPGSTILLTGTDRDPPLERWWGLGKDSRSVIIRAMIEARTGLVTTPNYSLFIDRPRWDDLHAMKRIAIIHEEFLREGLPAALHVNGRTESDFGRWAEYLADRTEITHLAYEFTTGTGWAGRQQQHALWLAELAAAAERPLHLLIRGGMDVLPLLARAFAGVTVLDTSIFMKTMKRQRASPRGNRALDWKGSPTLRGAPIDELFDDNCRIVEAWLGDLITASTEQVRMVG